MTHVSAHERTSEFFEGGRRERRQIITPEGVPLSVELADHGERAGRASPSTCSSG